MGIAVALVLLVVLASGRGRSRPSRSLCSSDVDELARRDAELRRGRGEELVTR